MSAESPSDGPQREGQAVQVQKRPKIAHRPTSPDHFRVAIFCALPVEAQAVKDFLGCCWDEDDALRERSATDQNAYTLGAVGRHNVVLVHMPRMGKGHAAKAAADASVASLKLKMPSWSASVAACRVETGRGISCSGTW
jgi:hypothetical protein